MLLRGWLAAVAMGLGFWVGPAEAAVNIQVDLSSQTMHVTSGSGDSYDWPVSTARDGYVTPRGTYGVQSLQAMHYSRKYHNSPMPHSIFFKGGYAIHGTYSTASLGAAASHGCVRLSPDHAAELYRMVRAEGARITIVGSRPAAAVRVARRSGGGERVAANPHRRDRGTVYARRSGGGDRIAANPHRRDRGAAYARRRGGDEAPLAYAPLRAAPSYDDWMQNPLGSLMDN